MKDGLSSDEVSTVKRLFGDASIIRDTLLDIASKSEDREMDYQEAYYFLRKCSDKANSIADEIERNFKAT